MSVVRVAVMAGLAAQLAGCFVFSMPPAVPKVNRPNLPPDTFIEANAGLERQRSSRRDTSTVCSGGSCTDFTVRTPTTISVRVAEPTVNGNPITIGEVAAAASPEYVSDTERARGLTSSCKRGRIVMTAAGVFVTGAFVLLSIGYNKENPNQAAAIGGIAAAGAGVGGLLLGRYVAGGQYCDDAEEIYNKWQPIYQYAGKTKAERDSAKLVEVLVDKFNQDRARVAKPEPEPTDEPTDAPAED
jgi:hypothetical protein